VAHAARRAAGRDAAVRVGPAAGDQAETEIGSEAALELSTAALSGLALGRFSGPVPILTVVNRPMTNIVPPV
jgi:hypothetical protein